VILVFKVVIDLGGKPFPAGRRHLDEAAARLRVLSSAKRVAADGWEGRIGIWSGGGDSAEVDYNFMAP
jgi:hypothetical protein